MRELLACSNRYGYEKAFFSPTVAQCRQHYGLYRWDTLLQKLLPNNCFKPCFWFLLKSIAASLPTSSQYCRCQYYLTLTWRKTFLRQSRYRTNYLPRTPWLIEPGSSTPHSQNVSINPYPESIQSNSSYWTYFFKTHSNTVPPCTPRPP